MKNIDKRVLQLNKKNYVHRREVTHIFLKGRVIKLNSSKELCRNSDGIRKVKQKN